MTPPPDMTSSGPRRSRTGPLVLGLILVVIVTACIVYFVRAHESSANGPAQQARWRAFQQEHARQADSAEKAFEQKQAAMKAAKKAKSNP